MSTIFLSDEGRHTLAGALYTAIERYRECAKAMAESPGHARLAEAFEKQIADCQALLEEVEE